MAIPYLDINPKGNGYYTIRQRPLAYAVFQFGFLQLWIVLILIGTFMRGPNWSFYGAVPAARNPHQTVAMTNISLAGICLGACVGPQPARKRRPTAASWCELGHILAREGFGLAALALYYVGLPLLAGSSRSSATCGRGWAADGIAIMILLWLTMLHLAAEDGARLDAAHEPPGEHAGVFLLFLNAECGMRNADLGSRNGETASGRAKRQPTADR